VESVKTNAVRSFLRSLNLLLKAARMYGFDHVRSAEQRKAAWEALNGCLRTEGAMKIAVSGTKLLVDGAPLKTNPVESGLAQMLSAAGVSSIHFTTQATEDEFIRFVRAFADSGAKFEGLVERLRSALGQNGNGIRVNEVRFVEADSDAVVGTAEAKAVGELAAQVLQRESCALREAASDPRKLLALLAAAMAQEPAGSPAAAAGERTINTAEQADTEERDLASVVQLLGKIGAGAAPGSNADAAQVQQETQNLSPSAKDLLRQALLSMEKDGRDESDPLLLVQLAERMAIQVAMKHAERGGAAGEIIRGTIGRMAQQISDLRKRLAAYEQRERAASAEPHLQQQWLERQLWAALPDDAKRNLLLSSEAWRRPIAEVRPFIENLILRDQKRIAADILTHYVGGIQSDDAAIRRAATEGTTELADLLGKLDESALSGAICVTGKQLIAETRSDVQLALNNLFVRLSHQAADGQRVDALKQVLVGLRALAGRHPDLASALRPRVGLENRAAEFVECALQNQQAAAKWFDVFHEMPEATAVSAAWLFSQTAQRERSDSLAEIVHQLGPPGLAALREKLQRGPDSKAVAVVGLLTRLEPGGVVEYLAARVPRWNHSYQNLAVRQVASSGSPQRGQILLRLLEWLDPLILPPALDEIGMTGDATTATELIRIAEGKAPRIGSPFLIVKAIEALGRLRASAAAPLLHRLVEEKELWIWTHPRELRVVALQALLEIEPEWGAKFLPASGLLQSEVALGLLKAAENAPGVRQRGYARFPVRTTIQALMKIGKSQYRLLLKDLSLGGGLATGEANLPSGTRAEITLGSGSAAVRAMVLLRGVRRNGVSFEFVDISLEDRSKLRKLLLDLQKQPA
jgi:hypothetical protein